MHRQVDLTPRRRRWWWRIGSAAAVLALGAGAAVALTDRSGQAAITYSGPEYPRTATYYLSHNDLPPVADLARYQLVVLDNEWAHNAPAGYFDQLRAANPAIVLLAYVDLVDVLDTVGSPGWWANNYALWQFQDSTTRTFPTEWLARTSSGEFVAPYPDRHLANLTDAAPRIDGMNFAEYGAAWVTDVVWSSGVWDGIYLDSWGDHVWTADIDSWDIDGDGVDESWDEIYGADGPWGRGLESAERIMRAAMPDAVIVANGDRTVTGGLINGRVWESFADPLAERDHTYDLASYVDGVAASDGKSPSTPLTIGLRRAEAGSADDYRRARYFLGSTLLQSGYWAQMGTDYAELTYYDEMDGGGRGPHYLGRAAAPNPTNDDLTRPYADGVGSVADGVYRRDFEHGIIVVNSTDAPQEVDLGGVFQHLRGTQDPVVNDGTSVDQVTVGPRDAVILVVG